MLDVGLENHSVLRALHVSSSEEEPQADHELQPRWRVTAKRPRIAHWGFDVKKIVLRRYGMRGFILLAFRCREYRTEKYRGNRSKH